MHGLRLEVLVDGGRRLAFEDIVASHPQLVRNLVQQERIALVMGRGRGEDIFVAGGVEYRGAAVKAMLARYEEPDIVYEQLARLNSFEQAGDLILFGVFRGGKQINFEPQLGGHGAFGGEQGHPFVLAKREWMIDTRSVIGAHQVHPILCALRDRLKKEEGPVARPALG